MRVLTAVRDGADIYSRQVAMLLRQMARRRPPLVDIVEAMGAPENGAARQPYFGCIATGAGRDLLAKEGA